MGAETFHHHQKCGPSAEGATAGATGYAVYAERCRWRTPCADEGGMIENVVWKSQRQPRSNTHCVVAHPTARAA